MRNHTTNYLTLQSTSGRLRLVFLRLPPSSPAGPALTSLLSVPTDGHSDYPVVLKQQSDTVDVCFYIQKRNKKIKQANKKKI